MSPGNLASRQFILWFWQLSINILCCTDPRAVNISWHAGHALSSAQITWSTEAQFTVTHLGCCCLFSLFAEPLLCADFTHIFLQLWNHSTWHYCSFSFSLSVISRECSPYQVGSVLKVFCSVLFSICFSCVFWPRKIRDRFFYLLLLTLQNSLFRKEHSACIKPPKIYAFIREQYLNAWYRGVSHILCDLNQKYNCELLKCSLVSSVDSCGFFF